MGTARLTTEAQPRTFTPLDRRISATLDTLTLELENDPGAFRRRWLRAWKRLAETRVPATCCGRCSVACGGRR
jgi:hypothetical protein